MLKSYFSGRNLAKFCPQKSTAVWESISEYRKSPPVKKPTVLWGTPISHSLWISGNFPGVGGLHVISLQPRNSLAKESLPFILTHPNRSNHYNLEFYRRECTVCSAVHPRPQALPAVHESEATDNSAFPYTEHAPQRVFHFSKCPAAQVFYHPCNRGMDRNALQPGALPYTS